MLKVLRKQKKINESYSIINEINTDFIKNDDLLIEIGETYIENNDYNKAIPILKRLIKLNNKNSYFLRRLSYCYFNNPDYPNFENLIFKNLDKNFLIAKENNTSDSFYDLSYHYLLTNNSEKSIEFLEKAYQVDNSKNSLEKFSINSQNILNNTFEGKIWSGELGRKYINLNNSVYQYAISNNPNEYKFYCYYSEFLLDSSFSQEEDKEILEKIIDVTTDGIKLVKHPYLFYIRALAKTNLSYNEEYKNDEESIKYKELINSAISDFTYATENPDFNDEFYFDKKFTPYLKGKLFQRIEDYEMQYFELLKSEKLYLDDNMEVSERIYYDLSLASYNCEKYDEGIKYCNIAIDLYEELCDSNNDKTDCDRSGYLYYILGNLSEKKLSYDSAMMNFIKSYETRPIINYSYGIKNSKYNPAILQAIQLAIYLDKSSIALDLLKESNKGSFNIEINDIFESIIKLKTGKKTNYEYEFNSSIFESSDWYDGRVVTNYLHFLYLNKEYEKIIEVCKYSRVDDGFLYILANAYKKIGDYFNAIITTTKLIEYIEYSQLNLDFINFINIDDANNFLADLKNKLSNN